MTTRQGRATPGVVLEMAVLCLFWLIPTSGWWTAFTWPPDLGQLSAASYRQAWYGGVAVSFLNSLAVTLPAVAIPVIAGPAAYAFAFLQVVTVTLGGLIGGNQILGWQVVTGGAIITMAVPVLVFVTLQRYFVRGLTAGSVGG